MTSAPASPRPHVLLVAAPFQSHVNPLLRLGRRLAAKDLLVTFTTVLRAGIRLGPGDGDGDAGDAAADDGAERGRLRVERLRGCGIWAPDDPRFRVAGDMARHVEAAAPAALEELVRGQAAAGRPVTCVVANAFVPWALRVAGELGLPRGMLWIQSCALLSVYYHHVHALAAFPDPEADAPGSVALPGLPELDADDLKPLLIYASGQDLWRQMLVTDLGRVRPGLVAASESDARQVPWVFANTFYELEHAAVEGLRAHLPVIPVGPLVEPDDDTGGKSSPASAAAAGDDDNGCAAWLDARPPRSVVFVAFGSLVNNDSDEVAEIAAGLAGTGRPFLWVVRDDNRALLTADALAAAACCSDRDEGRGKVVPWCAQGRVLAHPAVGCFVTHCGWNSTAEALAGGVPVVASPRWSDQRINARFLVDVHRIGARAPAPLTRDALRERVEEVMRGPEAEAMARRAASWREKARAAVRDGGSSDGGIQAFVDQIRRAGAWADVLAAHSRTWSLGSRRRFGV